MTGKVVKLTHRIKPYLRVLSLALFHWRHNWVVVWRPIHEPGFGALASVIVWCPDCDEQRQGDS